MTSVLLSLGSAVLAAVIVGLWLSRSQAGLLERARGLERERSRLEEELAALRGQLGEAQTARATAEAARTAERSAATERLAALGEAQERLTTAFKALSSDALRSNNTAFLELARSTLAQYQSQAQGELSARQAAIDALVRPLKDSLERVDRKIGELEEKRQSAYGALAEQLKSLNSAQLQLQSEAAKLSTALRSTAYAGSWGELQLRRVVEMADMLPYCDFCEQETEGALRADLVVRLPGGQRLVVDAKSPVQSYRDALDLPDESQRAGKLAEHAARIRGHIDALGAKAYWEQFQPAPEFVVLFVPGDHFLSAALQADATLLDRALSRKVLLATPTTLIALLKAAAYGWRQDSVSRNAEEISQVGRQLHDRIAVFSEHLEKVGRGLETAVRSYNGAVGSFESSLLPSARRFHDLGARGARELAPPTVVDTTARDVSKRS